MLRKYLGLDTTALYVTGMGRPNSREPQRIIQVCFGDMVGYFFVFVLHVNLKENVNLHYHL